MTEINECESRRAKNAMIVLEISCRVKKDETVLILTHKERILDAYALASAAVELEANPVIIDITEYIRTPSYESCRGIESIRSAIKAADVVIGSFNRRGFFWVLHLGFGLSGAFGNKADVYLTGEHRWMQLQIGMENWEITPKEIAAIPKRTKWLGNLLDSAQSIRVTSPAGTDFTFSLMQTRKYTPVLAIIPNYGEVAIVPQHGSESGIITIDGQAQLGVRPSNELNREPLRITVKSGHVKDVDGDPVQVERLKRLINSSGDTADHIDEVGIPTTRVEANDICWGADLTHSSKRIHIALGNNPRRNELVHGPLHMDCGINNTVITIDGQIIYKDGKFIDEV